MSAKKTTEQATDQTADLYDFTNLSDLPEELAKKLHTETSDRAQVYAEIVNGAPRPLNISEVIAVAIRKFGQSNVPGPQTVRAYLNAAHGLGLISKPSRQTYGPAGQADGTADTAEPQSETQADEGDDPLAKIS